MTPTTLLALIAIALWTGTVVSWCRRHPWGEAGRRFFRHPSATRGVVVLVFLATVALCAPLVTPYAPYQQILTLQDHPPTWLHPLGTDFIGRDVWSRLAYGSRVSLGVGTLGMLVAVTLGGLVGAAAGYFRGWTDAVLMRCVDVGLSIPRIFLVLGTIALWGKLGVGALILLLGLTGWFATSRIVRAEVMSVRERPYTDAVRALGARPWWIILRHVLPNSAAALIVSAALGIGNMMLLEAGLSFLGAGIQPPHPSWGNMIADGRDQLSTAPWATLFPGIAIALAVMALNATGDALRHALDPRARES
ncbi:MAG TPA: ABC transporter permease [Gemmatimonadales bacterium]